MVLQGKYILCKSKKKTEEKLSENVYLVSNDSFVVIMSDMLYHPSFLINSIFVPDADVVSWRSQYLH